MMFLAQPAKREIKKLATLMRHQGATSVETFLAEDADKGLVIANNEGVIDHPLLVPINPLFSGGKAGPNGGNYLFMVGIWTPAAARAEFLDWYRNEHLPILLECVTWNGCRFVERQVSDGHQFYALHQLADRSALESEQRRRSRATPWFMRLKQHAWFDEQFTRQLYVSFPE
jgi:hypothetical protein